METIKIFGVIYRITNTVNNKIYIGQTTREINERINEYKRGYRENHYFNQYLLNSFNKYGFDCFIFEVIDNANSIEELNEKEINYIAQYNSTDRNLGYNIESGGRNSKPSEETLIKMSESHKGIKQTEDWINKRIAKIGTEDAKKYGKEKTDEERTYLSINSPKFWQGKVRDEETRKKISETKLKQGFSILQKEINNRIVYMTNIITNEITYFESTAKAGKIINVHQSTISRWCLKNKIIGDFKWSYNEN